MKLLPVPTRQLLLLILCGASRTDTADAFCTRTATSSSVNYCRWKLGLLRAANNDADTGSSGGSSSMSSSMSKMESAGVKRFTIGYEKLCKNCPTRLEPRVDTLTEMILGLSDDDRGELMRNVAKRLELRSRRNELEEEAEAAMRKAMVSSSRDVYDFQTGGASVKLEKNNKSKRRRMEDKKRNASSSSALFKRPASSSSSTTTTTTTVRNENKEPDTATTTTTTPNNSKLQRKMDKARSKLDSNTRNIARAARLLAVTEALLAPESRHAKELSIGTADNGWYHDIDRLVRLGRAELKRERCKLIAQRGKYEGKAEKQEGRMKFYDASMAFEDCKRRKDAVVVRATSREEAAGATSEEVATQLQLMRR